VYSPRLYFGLVPKSISEFRLTAVPPAETSAVLDLMVEFQTKQNELSNLYDKGPLGQARGLPHISLPILVTNFSHWSRRALDFIAPRSRSLPKTATSRAADRHVSP